MPWEQCTGPEKFLLSQASAKVCNESWEAQLTRSDSWALTSWILLKYAHTQQTGQKVRKKVFNWSEVHLSEVTSYKIHSLD